MLNLLSLLPLFPYLFLFSFINTTKYASYI
nr:MAG TPA_asm: hypothetical protein [Caudoviricetes sp.]